MRAPSRPTARRLVVLAVAGLALTGCGAADADEPEVEGEPGVVETTGGEETDGDGPDGAGGEGADEPRTFAAGDPIDVTLTLLASDDGGRQTPYFDGYRPDVTFESGDLTVTCSFGVAADEADFAPGDTHDVEITCTEGVTVEPDALEFVVVEGGREVGHGTVR